MITFSRWLRHVFVNIRSGLITKVIEDIEDYKAFPDRRETQGNELSVTPYLRIKIVVVVVVVVAALGKRESDFTTWS